MMPDPIQCTIFLFLSLLVSGIGQTFWMSSNYSRRFSIAIDRGRTFRNRPILGANKTWRGFVFMIPATGLTFPCIGSLMQWFLGDDFDLWPLTMVQYFFLGCWTGLGFMLIELPNSFLKRQLNIQPGAPAGTRRARKACFVIDQIDSVVGGLLAVWIFVPIPIATAISLLLIGAVAHYGFNCVLLRMGLRTRAA